MKTLPFLTAALGMLLCSCALQTEKKPLRHAVEVEYSLDGPAAEFVVIEDIHSMLKRMGLCVTANHDDDADFEISVEVDVLDGFIDYAYQVYYRDTLYSVTLLVRVDGQINQSKTDYAFGMLNRELHELLRGFPAPRPEELKKEASESDDPFEQPVALSR